jgi:hypothetical protein
MTIILLVIGIAVLIAGGLYFLPGH